MEQQLKYDEWFFQSDYDLETARYMLQGERYSYCILMCHLSLDKAIIGLYIKRFNQQPPKIKDLKSYFKKLGIKPEETFLNFMSWLNILGISALYPVDLKEMLEKFQREQTNLIYRQTQEIQQWIMQQ